LPDPGAPEVTVSHGWLLDAAQPQLGGEIVVTELAPPAAVNDAEAAFNEYVHATDGVNDHVPDMVKPEAPRAATAQ
jgi:hypothetical protein